MLDITEADTATWSTELKAQTDSVFCNLTGHIICLDVISVSSAPAHGFPAGKHGKQPPEQFFKLRQIVMIFLECQHRTYIRIEAYAALDTQIPVNCGLGFRIHRDSALRAIRQTRLAPNAIAVYSHR
jgi:hypothetical protein